MPDEGSQRACPELGEVLGNKYEILRLIGEGGMGMVYEAMHQRLRHRVAVKVLRCDERKNAEIVSRFEREARTAAKLCGPNVARVTDVDLLPDGTPYMVMEYLDGQDLDTELEMRGPLPVEEAVGYVLQACSAVAEAHALGIVHRDLKPHNLFLTGESGARRVKLLDFGISKPASDDDGQVTITRSALGTPLYMSPEQIRSARRADARSDVWSLGVILYELLTGTTPFIGESPTAVIAAITADEARPPQELRADVPHELSETIMAALCKDPEQRVQNVAEFAERIQPFGPSGAWTPLAAGSSSPSNPRLSIPQLTDAPTIRAEDIVGNLAKQEAGSAAPVTASTDATQSGRSGRLVAAALVTGVAVLAGSIYFLTQNAAVGAKAPAPAALAERPSAEPQRAPPAAPTSAAPAASSAPAVAPVAPEPSAVVATKPTKPAVRGAQVKATSPAPTPTASAAPPKSAPPPPPAENPLTL